jgi:hypothetical protein
VESRFRPTRLLLSRPWPRTTGSLFRIAEGLHTDWTNADRSSETHVFAKGGHGFGMVKQPIPADRWTDLFPAWLDYLNP